MMPNEKEQLIKREQNQGELLRIVPTKRQIDYAKEIGQTLNIRLPEEYSKAAYREFISVNRERYHQLKPVITRHYTEEQIERARNVDILEYARSQGMELKREGRDYRARVYPGGFIITPGNNSWNWFDENRGGGVIQLCMLLENKTWQEAVGALLNEEMEVIRRIPEKNPEKELSKEFVLPEKNDTDKHVFAYLTRTREIDREIVKEMLKEGYLYENKQRSCVFVGRDNEGIPRHASVRSTNTYGNVYKKDVAGSQKKYSFSVPGTSGNLNVFEAPIDALSYMTLQRRLTGKTEDSYLSLGGVTDKALEQYLEDHAEIRSITVCTDGDEAGEKAAVRIQEKYGTQYRVIRQRPENKDFNEDLVNFSYLTSEDKQRIQEVFADKEDYSPPRAEITELTQENVMSHHGTRSERENLLRRKESHMEEQIVKLIGQPVSKEMKDILRRLSEKDYVSLEEINNTKEMKMARSNVDYSRPTIQLENREELQANIIDKLSRYGSVEFDENGKVVVDKDGNTLYNGSVERNSRLDIVIGLPASGKSSAIVNSLSNEFHSKVIDNDDAKKEIPQFNNGWGADIVHEESQWISDYVYQKAIRNHENIILPKVGSNPDKLISAYVYPAIKKGYEVNIHYVALDRNKALGRMLNRFIEEGRFLKPDLIEKYDNPQKGNRIEQSYESLKRKDEYIKGFSKWDNDVGRGEQPILVESYNLQGNYIEQARKGDVEYGQNREHLQPESVHVVGRNLRESRNSIRSINEVYDGERSNIGLNDNERAIGGNGDVLQGRESGRTNDENTTRASGNGVDIIEDGGRVDYERVENRNHGGIRIDGRDNGGGANDEQVLQVDAITAATQKREEAQNGLEIIADYGGTDLEEIMHLQAQYDEANQFLKDIAEKSQKEMSHDGTNGISPEIDILVEKFSTFQSKLHEKLIDDDTFYNNLSISKWDPKELSEALIAGETDEVKEALYELGQWDIGNSLQEERLNMLDGIRDTEINQGHLLYAGSRPESVESVKSHMTETIYTVRSENQERGYNVLFVQKEDNFQVYVESEEYGEPVAIVNALGTDTERSQSAKEYVVDMLGLFSQTDTVVISPVSDLSERIDDMTMRFEHASGTLDTILTYTENNVEKLAYAVDGETAENIADYILMNSDAPEQISDFAFTYRNEPEANMEQRIEATPAEQVHDISMDLNDLAFECYDPVLKEVNYVTVHPDAEKKELNVKLMDHDFTELENVVIHASNKRQLVSFYDIAADNLYSLKSMNATLDKVLNDTWESIPVSASRLTADMREKVFDDNDGMKPLQDTRMEYTLTTYDKADDNSTFKQSFYEIAIDDLSESMLLDIQRYAKGHDRFELCDSKGNILLKGDVTEDFVSVMENYLDESKINELGGEPVLGHREIKPISNEEIAKEIAQVLYAHDESLQDIDLDDIQADILLRLDDSVSSGDVEALDTLTTSLISIAPRLGETEKAVASRCVEQLEQLRQQEMKLEAEKRMEAQIREQANLQNEQKNTDEQMQSTGMSRTLNMIMQTETQSDNPLKSIEELVEVNGNFIDGIINNVPLDDASVDAAPSRHQHEKVERKLGRVENYKENSKGRKEISHSLKHNEEIG